MPYNTHVTRLQRLAPQLGVMLIVSLMATWPPVSAQSSALPPDVSDLKPAAAKLERIDSLLVSWRGSLIFQHYAHGARADRVANIKSASKSVISALTGIAIQRGLIKSVKEPIATFFPAIRRDPDPRKETITIENLLTMQSGLETTSNRNYGAWVQSHNWVQYALGRPLVSDPGTAMQYSTGSTHLLSAILTNVSGMNTWQFAQQALAKPLGISLAPWTRDPQGIYFGGNEMLMTPRQMIAFGELYLHRGHANGRQIVPEAWVDTSCVPRTASRFDPDRLYGYGWWTREVGGVTTCFAWGFGGQYIFVFRDLDLVIAATSSTTVSDERRGYRQRLLDAIEEHVVRPLDDYR